MPVSVPSRGSGRESAIKLTTGDACVVLVSVPSRGSGRESSRGSADEKLVYLIEKFPSPRGEVVVKVELLSYTYSTTMVSVPSRGSGRESSR